MGDVVLSRSAPKVLVVGLVFTLLSTGLLQIGPAGATPGEFVAVATVPVPSELGVSVAFDGTTFYYTNYGDPTLYGYTVACVGGTCDATLVLTVPIISTEGDAISVDGMAWDAGRGLLWAGGLDGVVYRIDPASGIATPAFTITACNPYNLVDGLAYDAEDDSIWFSADGSFSICHYSATGDLLASVPVSSIVGFPGGCYNSGLAVGGDWLYLGSNGCGQILRVDKDTFADGVLFASPGGRDEDMECDPLTFAPRSVIWSKDAYDNTVTAFEIEAGTCGIGGSPPCSDVPPLAMAVTRPAAFTRYVEDVPYASPTSTPIVMGDLTLRATTADDARVGSARWQIDGVNIPAGPAPDYAATWDPSSAAPGPHTLKFVVKDVVRNCPHVSSTEVTVLHAESEALARSVMVTATHPVEATLRSPGADGLHGPEMHRFLRIEVPAAGLVADAIEDRAQVGPSGTSGHASSVLTRVSLLDGRIQAEALRAEADARYSVENGTFVTSFEGSHVVGLVVDGTPIRVDGPDQVVEVPGVGRLVLLETSRVAGSGHGELRVHALHLYAAVEGFRGEVILGAAVAGVAIDGTPFRGLPRSVDPADDAGTQGDVGDAPGTARTLQAPALFGARLTPDDRADWYKVALKEGEKLEVVVKPAERIHLRTGVGTVPPTLVAVELEEARVDTDLRLVLRDPAGQVVLRSEAPLTAPERLELNVDMDGDWTIGVLGTGLTTNYTFALAVTPVAFVDAAPVGASCGDPSAPVLDGDRPVVDALRAGDGSQWFRLPAAIGDDLAVSLHPLDADGADFDLYVYDRACALLTWSDLGKSILWQGDVPKGVPDAVAVVPSLYTGDYWVEVRRIVGVGNYALAGRAEAVLPTLPGNDASTGSDASDDASQGTLIAGNGAWEGTFHEGDPRDAYTFHAEAGKRVTVTFLASPGNSGTLVLLDPNGNVLPTEHGTQLGAAAISQTFRLGAAGDLTLVLSPQVGGGNYLFTVTQT